MLLAEYRFEGEAPRSKLEDFEYLQFHVPEGACSVEVEYDWGGKSPGEAVVDLGLFEPGPTGLVEGMQSLRGWSGSSKKRVCASRGYATPGYLPGEVRPGQWAVVLGFYKVPEAGLWYRVAVRVYSGCAEARESRPEPPPPGVKRGWVKGDLHMHSVHSDGDSTLGEVAALASRLGLDFISVTDHNTVSQIAELGWRSAFLNGVFVLRGVEMTSYKGHMNVFGISEVPEFRVKARRELEAVVAYLRSKGAFLSVNHPKPLGPDWELGDMSFADAVEVFQAVWEFNNYVSLRKWDELLKRGLRVGLVGGSDAHEMKSGESLLAPGVPTTWVYVDELSEEGLLRGLRAQRVFVSESPSGPRVFLKALQGGREYTLGDTVDAGPLDLVVRVEGAEGQTLRLVAGGEVVAHREVDSEVFEGKFSLLLGSPYVRAELLREAADVEDPYHMENIVSALTAPIYLKRVE